MPDQRVSDSLIGCAFELEECADVHFKYLLVILVVDGRKNNSRNIGEVALNIVRNIRNLHTGKYTVVVSIKVDDNRVFPVEDLFLLHQTFCVPNVELADGLVFKFKIVFLEARRCDCVSEQVFPW